MIDNDIEYIVTITSSSDPFQCKKVFGPFSNTDEIKQWLEDKHYNWAYHIDIYPLINPSNKGV